jgi:hypothetical protein
VGILTGRAVGSAVGSVAGNPTWSLLAESDYATNPAIPWPQANAIDPLGVCEERCKLNRVDRSLIREELMIYLEALLGIEIMKITSDSLALQNSKKQNMMPPKSME